MTEFAHVTRDNGRFYITPLQAQLNGMSWETKSDAEYICRAVNAAYESGREEIRRELRELLNVKERGEDDY